VYRARILDDPVICTGGVEILFEHVVLFALDEGIICAVQNQFLALTVPGAGACLAA
jgi:hypothetical protein